MVFLSLNCLGTLQPSTYTVYTFAESTSIQAKAVDSGVNLSDTGQVKRLCVVFSPLPFYMASTSKLNLLLGVLDYIIHSICTHHNFVVCLQEGAVIHLENNK